MQKRSHENHYRKTLSRIPAAAGNKIKMGKRSFLRFPPVAIPAEL